MPEDARLPFDFDEGGDIETVSGDDFYYNHAQQLALLAVQDERASGLTATDIQKIQGEISDTIAASPYFERPRDVNITVKNDETIVADVTLFDFTEYTIEI